MVLAMLWIPTKVAVRGMFEWLSRVGDYLGSIRDHCGVVSQNSSALDLKTVTENFFCEHNKSLNTFTQHGAEQKGGLNKFGGRKRKRHSGNLNK